MNEAFVVKPAPLSCLSTTDGAFFPLRRIYCVARNYADHALEMGHDPGREPPFFFKKILRIFAQMGFSRIRGRAPMCITKSS
jgi:2-keto-4-pentenoate hydratase/2-oxohepta-3-ene-1,7-dioic acid hydratase (catechol pathway)